MYAGERRRMLLCTAVQYCLQQGQNVRRLKLLEQHAMSAVKQLPMFLKDCSASIFTVKQSMGNEVNGPLYF
jgi:hypothetical protein